MKTQNRNFSDPSGFDAVNKAAFFIERKNVSSPSPFPHYHYHDCYELYYLYAGERYYFIRDKTYHIEGGSFVLIKPYEIHSSANFAQCGYDRLLINFKKDFLADFLGETKNVNLFECFDSNIHTILLNPQEQHFAELMLENMVQEYREHPVLDNLHLKISLIQLLLYINKHRISSCANILKYVNSTHKTISEIIGYINNHYAEDITLSTISECFYVSPCYFSRTFKKVSGLPFTDYLNSVRIKEARKLLAKTNMPISEVSGAVGFKSNTHFDRVFKKITGMSPLTYKKELFKSHKN